VAGNCGARAPIAQPSLGEAPRQKIFCKSNAGWPTLIKKEINQAQNCKNL